MKSLFFDVDGVSLLPRTMSLSDKLRHDYGEDSFKPLFQKGFYDCVVGKSDLKELLITEYLPKLGWTKPVESFLEYWWSCDGKPNLPLLAEINSLRKRAVHCYLILDQEKYRASHLLNTLELKNFFDGWFLSAEIGVRKTESAFWDVVLRSSVIENLFEVYYWDDEEENLSILNKLGMNGILYSDVDSFRKDVVKMGIAPFT